VKKHNNNYKLFIGKFIMNRMKYRCVLSWRWVTSKYAKGCDQRDGEICKGMRGGRKCPVIEESRARRERRNAIDARIVGDDYFS
jgi:hypothetical protein